VACKHGGSQLICISHNHSFYEDGEPHPMLAAMRGAEAARAAETPTEGWIMPAGLYGGSPPRIKDKAFEAELCSMACECVNNRPPDLTPLSEGGTHQSCVDAQIRAKHYERPYRPDEDNPTAIYPRDNAPMWSEVSFYKRDVAPTSVDPHWHSEFDMVMSRSYPDKPSHYFPRRDTWRIDVVKINKNGKPEKFYDMKFSKADMDDLMSHPDRLKAYRKIAVRYTGSEDNFVPFDVQKRCGCLQKKQEEERQKQQEPQEEPKSLIQRFMEFFRSPRQRPEEQLSPTPEYQPFPQPRPMPMPMPMPVPFAVPV
jgi:hypothetical protein